MIYELFSYKNSVEIYRLNRGEDIQIVLSRDSDIHRTLLSYFSVAFLYPSRLVTRRYVLIFL